MFRSCPSQPIAPKPAIQRTRSTINTQAAEPWLWRIDAASGLLAPTGERGAVGEPYRSKFLANIDNAKTYHDDMKHWKYEGKTWTIYGTGPVTDTKSHLDLPPEHPEVSFWGTVGAQLNPFGPGVRYKAKRADGSEVGLDPDEAFPLNRGYNKDKSCTTHGDGTVPATSARALFPGEHQRWAAGTDYTQKHQFEVVHGQGGNAEHDKICDHSDCVKLVREIVSHIISLPHGQ